MGRRVPIVNQYDELNDNTLYYTFDAKKNDKLFASIVIPKLDGLENFTPSLVFITPSFSIDLITELKILDSQEPFPFPVPDGYDAAVFDYNGLLPSKEFYEPFGQITYWERQEINLVAPVDATYYLAVYDKKGNNGKLAVAVGYVEDFSAFDFMTVLPTAWFESKYFMEDYITPAVAILIMAVIVATTAILVYRIASRIKVRH